MSTAPEEFEKLQKLLKLKRYEQPPPGYFNRFSTQVLNKIEAEQARNARSWGGLAWLGRFMTLLETNPLAAGLFGVSVCGLLVSGITLSQAQSDTEMAGSSAIPVNLAELVPSSSGSGWTRSSTRVDEMAPSVNPLFSTNVPGSVFDRFSLTATPVNFSVSH